MVLIITLAVACAVVAPAAADTQSQLNAARAHAHALSGTVAQWSARINALQSKIAPVEQKLNALQAGLDAKRAQIDKTHAEQVAARARLARLQLRLQRGNAALADHLVATYESDHPDLVTVVIEATGFSQLLERIDFLKRVRAQDTRILQAVTAARTEVIAAATALGAAQVRQERAAAVLAKQTAVVNKAHLALVGQRISLENARAAQAARLGAAQATQRRLAAKLRSLHAQAASLSTPAATSSPKPSGAAPSVGGFNFPMPKGSASAPGTWSLDQGVDISAPGHTPLYAVGSGTVVLHGIGGFGADAPVLHLDSGRYVYYGHAGPGNAVAIGTHVGAGAVIGEVGAGIVGISTGPHLEIGFADGNGTPAPGTASTMMSLLQGSY